jgi:pSer/pThr/pTyr-binding forkhead associated (FHA) protein
VRLIYERGQERIAFPLDDRETFIGRKDDCQIYFPDSSLSKRHAKLVRQRGGLTVSDAGSTNGTLVNGDRIEAPVRLKNGDVVQCGKLAFTVEGLGKGEFDYVEESESEASSSGSGEADEPATKVEAPAITARLRLVEGGTPQTFELTGETITIGSKPENTIVVVGEGVSRYHAEVVHEGGKWVVKDLNARNGTFVGGKKIDLHTLVENDEIGIGTSAKLRFELVKPAPLHEVKALLSLLKSDPIGTIKNDGRVRSALACVLGAVVLLWLALPDGPKKAKDPISGDALALVLEGTTKLAEGKFREARTAFGAAQRKANTTEQEVPRRLGEVATLYGDTADDPMRFRWDKAELLLDECVRMEQLPAQAKTWIEDQLGRVRINRVAYDKLRDADTTGASAAALAEQKKFADALKRFELTILRYSEVDAQSAFGPRAREQAAAVTAQLFRLVLAEIRTAMQAADWPGAVGIIGQGEPFAVTPEQRAELRSLKDECETNQRDEQIYMQAVDVATRRDDDKYPEAQQQLAQINRRSRIYPDAQAYIAWMEADLQVRQAQRAYDQGEAERALKLLNEALKHDILGKVARESVTERRTKWRIVINTYNQGLRNKTEGRTAEAQEDFRHVLEREPNPNNRFHVLAEAELRHIEVLESSDLETKLKNGLDALEAKEFARAHQCFLEVEQDRHVQPKDLERIRTAVKRANETSRLLSRARDLFRRDRADTFTDILFTAELLRHWLPESDPEQRAEAERLHAAVYKRLKALERRE